MPEHLSYTQELRVIGQNLDVFGIDGFDLARLGAVYAVESAQLTRKVSAEKGFLSKITQKILGREEPDEEIPTVLHFTAADISSTDTQRRLKRKPSDNPTDRRDLSFVLRVVGDFLDRKNAQQFTISYSKDSIRLYYDQKQEQFTPQTLYDYGIHMYLKRSSRDRPTEVRR